MGRIELKKLNNTRDLGGIDVADGCIRPGRLFRSGMLESASISDRHWLRENVSVVIDFRSGREIFESPDPYIEGVECIHLPIIDDVAAGVSRDSQSDEEAIDLLKANPDSAMSYMCRMYEKFVTSETSRRGYEAFTRKILESGDRGVLWHCTVGKDRAGFGTAIVLEMLGADRETIISDYLETNQYIEQDVKAMVNFFFGVIENPDSDTETALRTLFGARREFIEAAFAKAEELYGSFRGYIRDGLHVSDEDIAAWKAGIVAEGGQA